MRCTHPSIRQQSTIMSSAVLYRHIECLWVRCLVPTSLPVTQASSHIFLLLLLRLFFYLFLLVLLYGCRSATWWKRQVCAYIGSYTYILYALGAHHSILIYVKQTLHVLMHVYMVERRGENKTERYCNEVVFDVCPFFHLLVTRWYGNFTASLLYILKFT